MKNRESGDSLDDFVFRDIKTERMRTLKGLEGIMSVGNVVLKDLVVEESSDSLLVTAKAKIYLPEKNIILMDQTTDYKSELFMGINKNKGGLYV